MLKIGCLNYLLKFKLATESGDVTLKTLPKSRLLLLLLTWLYFLSRFPSTALPKVFFSILAAEGRSPSLARVKLVDLTCVWHKLGHLTAPPSVPKLE